MGQWLDVVNTVMNLWVLYDYGKSNYLTSDPHSIRRMASSVMLHRVALVRIDVSEELSASIIRVTRIGELGTTLAVTNNRRTVTLFLAHPFLSPW
jgi:hypothetical protein